jgi:phosphoribosyl 1,2-cyclic phosphodiesterase
MSLRARFWGTRGSVPSPGASTVRYGGNTPCIELRTASDSLLILDAGTGIRELGHALVDRAGGAPIAGEIFLTHAHWDHIQGLPFFAPLLHQGNRFTIWGSSTSSRSLERIVREQMSPLVFPVELGQLAATIEFRELENGSAARIGGVGDGAARQGYEVSAFPVRHPGGALGFRFAERSAPDAAPGPGFVYISDNELNPAATYESASTWRRDLVRFVSGARILVHNSMFTADEYAPHRGWGHSTYEDAVDLAIDAGVGTLVLFHHKPERTDDEVDRWTELCRRRVAERSGGANGPTVIAAAEGLTLTV